MPDLFLDQLYILFNNRSPHQAIRKPLLTSTRKETTSNCQIFIAVEHVVQGNIGFATEDARLNRYQSILHEVFHL